MSRQKMILSSEVCHLCVWCYRLWSGLIRVSSSILLVFFVSGYGVRLTYPHSAF